MSTNSIRFHTPSRANVRIGNPSKDQSAVDFQDAPHEARFPLISILLPNYNFRQFLDARFESIFAQSYSNWELLVVDGYSDDGAWEVIQGYAEKDARIRIAQAPREGVYAALNICLEAARGDLIYIATSDDTMDSDCLDRMATALIMSPECGICHCCLRVIDESNRRLDGKWNWRDFPVSRYFGTLLDQAHLRKAPHDGFLHCAVYTVYTSLTQLLVRKSVFEDTGPFRTDIGPGADLEWGMRASLTTNVIHIPYELATWRVHEAQLTSLGPKLETEKSHELFSRMVRSAYDSLKRRDPALYRRIKLRDLEFPYRRLQVHFGIWERSGNLSRLLYLARMLAVSAPAVISFLLDYWRRREFDAGQYIRNIMTRYGYDDLLHETPSLAGELPKDGRQESVAENPNRSAS